MTCGEAKLSFEIQFRGKDQADFFIGHELTDLFFCMDICSILQVGPDAWPQLFTLLLLLLFVFFLLSVDIWIQSWPKLATSLLNSGCISPLLLIRPFNFFAPRKYFLAQRYRGAQFDDQ